MSGFVKLQRDIFEHHLFANNKRRLLIFIWIIQRCNYEDAKCDIEGKTVTIKRGQFYTSIRKLAQETGETASAINRALKRFESETMIETVKIGKGTLISCVNYEKHQGSKKDTETVNETLTKQYRNNSETIVNTSKEIKKERKKEYISSNKLEDSSTFNFYFENWNDKMPNKIKALNGSRKLKLKNRLKEDKNFKDNFLAAIEKIKSTPFLRGENNMRWKASFDWLIHNDANCTKVLEGVYGQEVEGEKEAEVKLTESEIEARKILDKKDQEWEQCLKDLRELSNDEYQKKYQNKDATVSCR